MYVYLSSSFERELKKSKNNKLAERIESLCSSCEALNVAQAQERFERIHAYLKKKEGQFRLIAKLMRVGKEQVLCFLKLCLRGESEYRHFLEQVKHRNDLFQESQLTDEIARWLMQQEYEPSTVVPNTVPDELRIWLERPQWQVEWDGVEIRESFLWQERFKEPQFRGAMDEYRLLVEALLIDYPVMGTATQWQQIRFYQQGSLGVFYRNLHLDSPGDRVLLLIAPAKAEKDTRSLIPVGDSGIFERLQKTQPHWDDGIDLDFTARSYPGYLILDRNFWLKIQSGERVNLALSAEERKLLLEASINKSLPLFLNGRAGSGKSTMLFYLFAYYCQRYLQLCQQQQVTVGQIPSPLFLTYSADLAEFAQERVQSILKHHHRFVSESIHPDCFAKTSAFFQSLRPFLLRLLPAAEKTKFTEDKYISFHQFRDLCNARWNNYSAEKSWLVIQTFIKGYELKERDVYLDTVQQYQQIPKKERVVSVAEYAEILETVWRWYLKYTKDNELWDDRDLVRTILDLGCYEPRYSVIFCDEAQDFTRLELQLIMSLSVFSLYNLEREAVYSLPFAFAGDPLQTLNPSGFRWAGFQAAFHGEILDPLGLAQSNSLHLDLQQLEYNYRSAAAIVKVNNLIQLWRKLWFDLGEIQPQRAKKINSFMPQKLILQGDTDLERLRQSLSGTIVLIPCDEGAEDRFIEADELLSSLAQDKSIDRTWNVLSAISAKGLEFSQVVLYRFGEACTIDFNHLKEEKTEEDKYFLNKLYVAASRATEKLFVVDSLEGEIKLWSYASDRNFLDACLSQIEDGSAKQQWQTNIELLRENNTLADLNPEDVESLGDKLAAGGKTGNINLLTRAIAAYQTANNQAKADACEAQKLKLQRDWNPAGEIFQRLAQYDEALWCFWQGQNWQQLGSLLKDFRENERFANLIPVIGFMAEDTSANLSQIHDFLLEEGKSDRYESIYQTESWQAFLNSYYQQVAKYLSDSSFSTDICKQVAEVLTHYYESSFQNIPQLVIQALYKARNYQKVIDYWEQSDLSLAETKYYYLSLARLAPLPQQLNYLNRAKQYKTTVRLWQKHQINSADWLKPVAFALMQLESYRNALVLYCRLNKFEKVQQCWENIQQPTVKQLKLIIGYYFSQQHWQAAIALYPQQLSTRQSQSYFLHSLASSKLNPQRLNKNLRQQYQSLVDSFLEDNRWREYLAVKQLGTALEKIGLLNSTLSFYEQYVNETDLEVQSFARSRWIATKQKQVDYFKSKVKLAKLQTSQQQLSDKVQQWNIDASSLESLPIVPPSPFRRTSGTKSHVKITGLPPGVKAIAVAKDILQLQLQHLLLRITPVSKQLTISDLLHGKTIYLDWKQGKAQLGTTTIDTSDRLSFSDSQGQYQGTLYRSEDPRLELKASVLSKPVVIRFN